MRNAQFADWLISEVESRGWSYRELARRAELSPSTISKVITGASFPGAEFCRGVARALEFPPETVFRKAGMLPPAPQMKATYREALHLFAQLPEELQHATLVQMRAWIEERRDAPIQSGARQPVSKTAS